MTNCLQLPNLMTYNRTKEKDNVFVKKFDIHNLLREETGCLTGHRPKGLPWGYDETKKSCQSFKKD